MILSQHRQDALDLWVTTEPYSSFPCGTIAWRLLPALDSGQIKLFYRDDKCVGLVTWAFMTEEEFDTREYDGSEIFSRDSGDLLVVIDMIAPGGRSDVLWISRSMQKYLHSCYPGVSKIFGHRGERVGFFTNKGTWNEVHAA